MKAANPALLALFATNQHFEQFDLYTFTLSSGFVMRYATCPYDVQFGGVTWLCARSPGGVVIDEAGDSGPRGHWTMGFDTGSWLVTIMPRPADVIGAIPWLPAVIAQILQEATVRVDRGYVLAWPPPALTLVPIGLVNVFFGRVAEIDLGRSSVQININDPRELLDIDMPRNLYSAQCRYALFDSQCSLNRAAFAVNCAVNAQTGGNTTTFSANFPGVADNYYMLGSAVFTSGQNQGLRLMIRSQLSGVLSMIAPFPFQMETGDTLTVYPGCNKTPATCAGKFNNLINYGGFPLIPAVETAI
jgi:Phage conserved hypothetical protein BR0599/Uncharacterized conserved protein (DUF2163)